ncbi:MAG: hypothetical protein NZ772_13940 [Cyanobacteria bacterium]|nr:hypothetical protein [Cyanobacteriota bacterium]MDW8202480.1 hypothetical protein [Cyanobacteriota bacterium SKYGB_h_bin112]
MAQVDLHWLVTKAASLPLSSLVAAIGSPVTIHSADGAVLAEYSGRHLSAALEAELGCYKIIAGDQELGWVLGGYGSDAIAEFLSYTAELHLHISNLSLQVDTLKGARPVAEITEDDYFQKLQRRVKPFKPIKSLSKD